MTQPVTNSLATFRSFAALQWLTLPIMALLFAADWQRLPSRLATHFDFANRANGWMSREEALVTFLALATAFSITSTWITSRVTEPDIAAWGLVGLFYVISGTLIWAEQSVVAFNIYGQPLNLLPILVVGMASAVLVIICALGTQGGARLPAARVLAEEWHASTVWALVLSLATLLVLGIIARVPIAAVRIALGIALLMMCAAVAMAWSGFHYVFTAAGLEIRTLGFCLCSVFAGDIRSYAVDRWKVLGGYGIRGVGGRRAYVWSNSGVRIQTNRGELFLGHSQPERLMRDLDKVTRNQKGPEATRI